MHTTQLFRLSTIISITSAESSNECKNEYKEHVNNTTSSSVVYLDHTIASNMKALTESN